MNKKAFTLTELLGVIVILAIIAIIAFPSVLGLLNNSQNETDTAMQNFAITAAREYVNDNMDSYPKALEGKTKTYSNLKVQTLIDNGYISSTTISKEKNCEMLNDEIKITSDSTKYSYEYITVDGGC